MSFSKYIATTIAALFTCAMGIMYLVALHIENSPDETLREAFITGMTLTTGSLAIERTVMVAQAKGNGNGTKQGNNGGSTDSTGNDRTGK